MDSVYFRTSAIACWCFKQIQYLMYFIIPFIDQQGHRATQQLIPGSFRTPGSLCCCVQNNGNTK